MSKSEHKKNTFFCNTCNYHTNRKSNYNRHINSTKHIEANNNIPIKNVLCKNKKKKKSVCFYLSMWKRICVFFWFIKT